MEIHYTDFVFLLLCCKGFTAQRSESPGSLTLSDQPEISDSVPPRCWNFTYGDPSEMEFFSPNFPSNYSTNLNCARYIEAPPGYKIHLYFWEWFEIEVSQECKFDYLAVHDGPFSYSPKIAKLCGNEYPSKIITSSTRFMWLQFVSDKNLGGRGFKVTYTFVAQSGYKEKEEEQKVCRIHYDKKVGPEGEITSDMIPFADTSSPGYPVNKPIDCTWEIDAERHSKIALAQVTTYFHSAGNCGLNKIEIYDGSTLNKDKRKQNCGPGPFEPFESKTNKVFVRIFGSSLNYKPTINLLFTKFYKNETCNSKHFSCNGRCISNTLACNGKINCPSGLDEENCDLDDSETVGLGFESLPLHAIIIGAVGGVLGTIIVIGVCLICRYRSRKRQKQRQEQRDKLKENFEMSNISANTTLLTKKNAGQPNYFSLPRQHRSGGQRDYIRRDSGTNSSVPSEGDVPDHNSDPGNYKKYLVMDQYLDEEPCPSVYSQGPVLTTIIERHDVPMQQQEIDGSYGWTGYGWKPPQSDNKSPMSLTENIAKLAQYNIPQKTLNPDYKMYTSDPKYEMYPELRYNIGKDYSKLKYPHPQQHQPEITTPTKEHQKSFKMSSPHPDITRDLEVT
ncbi:neuropilin and tolloid-like protein 2 [Mytilus edulis]|uniref:neuropilin and tolloid-like protein 2 n=1 Tax=Mytilus edulis TaxID=6550 RepID=UPI0039EEE556